MVYLRNLLRGSSLQNMKLLSCQKFLSCSVCGNLSNSGNKFTNYRHYSAALNSEVSRPSNQINRTLFSNKCKGNVVFYNSNHLPKSSFHSITEIYMAVSESTPVTTTQNLLVSIHETSGLPWWATIAVTTILLRSTVTMPLALYQHYILAKVENLKSELPPIAKELQKETEIATKRFNWTPELATYMYRRSLKKQWRLLIERDNCHPAKAGILVLFQIPMWILLSLSMRNLVYMRPHHDEVAQEIFHQLEHEGLLWIPNLTVPDTTMLIPSILCVVSLSIVEINRLMHKRESTRYKTVLINIFRGFAVLSFPFAMIVPSILSFYWLTSATFGLCQNLIVMSPKVKLFAGIPRTPTTLSNPYSHLWQQIKINLNVKKPA